MLIPQIGYYISLLFAGYFLTGTFVLSSFFLIIAPFPVAIFVGLKFGKTDRAKLGLAGLCLVLAFCSINFRLLPREVYMPPFVSKCKKEFNHAKMEEFRQEIFDKYYSGALKIKDDDYRFWCGLSAYVADSEKSDYIKENFVEIGLKLRNDRIDKLYFMINEDLWGIFFIPPEPYVLTSNFGERKSNSWYEKNMIFVNYYGFKR